MAGEETVTLASAGRRVETARRHWHGLAEVAVAEALACGEIGDLLLLVQQLAALKVIVVCVPLCEELHIVFFGGHCHWPPLGAGVHEQASACTSNRLFCGVEGVVETHCSGTFSCTDTEALL